MSLRNYLFALFAVFILVVSGIQIMLIENVRAQITEEISSKTNTISNIAIKTLQDELSKTFIDNGLTQTPRQKFSIKIANTPNAKINVTDDLVMVTGNKTQTVTIERLSPQQNRSIDIIKEASKKEAVTFSESAYALNLSFLDQDNIQKIITFDRETNSVDKYFNNLLLLLTVVTMFALALAFWLAGFISKPLSKLNTGFSNLSQGEFGIQLKEQGIAELKQTLQMFNKTSIRLQELQSLEQHYQQQQQLAELGEVARGLAHTLRNPLNTIGLGIEHLQQSNLEYDEQTRVTRDIQNKIQHLDKTIKSLLHLSNNKVDRSVSVDVVNIVHDILLELSSTTQIMLNFEPTSPVLFKCSEHEIRAMFYVLISNAVEASEESGKVSIKLQKTFVKTPISKQQAGIQLDVIDQGLGIDEGVFKDLFKPHVTSKPEGAGMGLFILKRLCQLYYSGSVELKNRNPNGCHACLKLFKSD